MSMPNQQGGAGQAAQAEATYVINRSIFNNAVLLANVDAEACARIFSIIQFTAMPQQAVEAPAPVVVAAQPERPRGIRTEVWIINCEVADQISDALHRYRFYSEGTCYPVDAGLRVTHLLIAGNSIKQIMVMLGFLEASGADIRYLDILMYGPTRDTLVDLQRATGYATCLRFSDDIQRALIRCKQVFIEGPQRRRIPGYNHVELEEAAREEVGEAPPMEPPRPQPPRPLQSPRIPPPPPAAMPASPRIPPQAIPSPSPRAPVAPRQPPQGLKRDSPSSARYPCNNEFRIPLKRNVTRAPDTVNNEDEEGCVEPCEHPECCHRQENKQQDIDNNLANQDDDMLEQEEGELEPLPPLPKSDGSADDNSKASGSEQLKKALAHSSSNLAKTPLSSRLSKADQPSTSAASYDPYGLFDEDPSSAAVEKQKRKIQEAKEKTAENARRRNEQAKK